MHQDLPFELLVEALNPDRDLSHSPIFQVAFTLQMSQVEMINLPELTIEPVFMPSETSKFDITMVLSEFGEELLGTVEYNTDLFEPDTIQRLIGHYMVLLMESLTTLTKIF